ncbi:unnamed protein product [marine sediment metagenome]|uniref:Uncharacterized protein n=1 Tax=marine sediment metagenome TaxID=412755 RepID=X0YWB3_9ZZZZ
MGLVADLWSGIPKELKIIFGIAVFLNSGYAILWVMIFAWNLLVINGMNAINGCMTDTPEACVPALDGIYIFGINFANYWVIVALIFLPAMALFAIKWYSLTLNK